MKSTITTMSRSSPIPANTTRFIGDVTAEPTLCAGIITLQTLHCELPSESSSNVWPRGAISCCSAKISSHTEHALPSVKPPVKQVAATAGISVSAWPRAAAAWIVHTVQICGAVQEGLSSRTCPLAGASSTMQRVQICGIVQVAADPGL